MDPESLNLKRHIAQLSDDELLEMVTKPREYRPEALGFARAEIEARGLDFSEPPVDQEEAAPQSMEPFLASHGPTCPGCKGPLRYGTLVGEKELIVIFTDNREERFIRASACSQCGQVSLIVDYETDVQ